MEEQKITSRIPLTPDIQAKLDAAADSGEEVDIAELLSGLPSDNVAEAKPMPENWTPDPNMFGFLAGLNRTMTNIYGGQANPNKVAKQRAKNKLARKSRQTNRRR